ncbi:hypothetical protein, conserved [Plasmodium gonderi]|uniref:Uncharacterized protein n=1 Tax=Plasmodium gonderi TaxID=77519 RepID=A0A1Y1JQE7_PLAGO|nr:hypothetical protein, conserved [Plasmodium gonderi]GAW83738.1 hypothetical protein, conserved [Plasmodium gonderi]
MNEGLDLHLVDEEVEHIGYINTDEEINKKMIIYLNMCLKYIDEKKLKSCEEFISGLLPSLKDNPFEYIIFITIKIYCNLRLHSYRFVSNDLSSLGNLDADNYQFEQFESKYKKKKGSMIPFLLRLINCYYPYTLNLYFTSFDRLYLLILHYENLLNECSITIPPVTHGKNVNNCVVENGITNNDIHTKNEVTDFTNLNKKQKVILKNIIITCYVLCDLLLKKNYIDQGIQLLRNKILRYNPRHISTISLIGKLSLLMGALEDAESSFSLVEKLLQIDIKSDDNYLEKLTDAHIHTNRAFLNMYLEDYPTALNEILKIHFNIEEKVEEEKKKNSNVMENYYAVYSNNLAVSYFFNHDVKKSIHIMEKTLENNYINSYPALVKNLNRVYEFTKTKAETVNQIYNFIRHNLNEDQEILAIIPRKG